MSAPGGWGRAEGGRATRTQVSRRRGILGYSRTKKGTTKTKTKLLKKYLPAEQEVLEFLPAAERVPHKLAAVGGVRDAQPLPPRRRVQRREGDKRLGAVLQAALAGQ